MDAHDREREEWNAYDSERERSGAGERERESGGSSHIDAFEETGCLVGQLSRPLPRSLLPHPSLLLLPQLLSQLGGRL